MGLKYPNMEAPMMIQHITRNGRVKAAVATLAFRLRQVAATTTAVAVVLAI
jgi:hypothetical protein